MQKEAAAVARVHRSRRARANTAAPTESLHIQTVRSFVSFDIFWKLCRDVAAGGIKVPPIAAQATVKATMCLGTTTQNSSQKTGDHLCQWVLEILLDFEEAWVAAAPNDRNRRGDVQNKGRT